MKNEKLAEGLRELERRGWPVEVGSEGAALINYSDGLLQVIHLDQPGELHVVEEDVLAGWLVAQLVACGLRREVYQHFGFGLCQVMIIGSTQEIYVKYPGGWRDDELTSLLQACLALPHDQFTTPDTSDDPPTGETTAAGDSYGAPDDPAVKPEPVGDKEGENG